MSDSPWGVFVTEMIKNYGRRDPECAWCHRRVWMALQGFYFGGTDHRPRRRRSEERNAVGVRPVAVGRARGAGPEEQAKEADAMMSESQSG